MKVVRSSGSHTGHLFPKECPWNSFSLGSESTPGPCCGRKEIKSVPRQAEMVLGVPGRLRLPIFLTFGTARVVDRQPYAPAAFNSGEIPDTHFQGLSRPQGTWLCRKVPRKKSPLTPPGMDPGTVRLEAHRLNHYDTPDPGQKEICH